jgi:1-acyl-sn-glycerol-3-phosphate acyltransferase
MLDLGKRSFFIRALRATFLFVMRVLFRIEYHGWESIPREGPLLIVANHVTYFDPPWVAARIYRRLRYMAWDKLLEIPIAGRIMRWSGAFPVSLENPESSAYKAALKILLDGEALMIFPEGGRSPDGRLRPFKIGAARLALRTGAPIVPAVIHGGENVWSPQMLLPRPGKVRVDYLTPITKEGFPEDAAKLMEKVRETMLSRQQAVGSRQ